MSNANVSTGIDGHGIATVTMNRPERHNAFDEHVIADLQSTFDALAGNDSVRAMILRSEGRHFCAGADVNWMKRMAGFSLEENIHDAGALAGMLKALNFLPFPTIARVQGAALGGGAGLVCCCDIVVAASDAAFAFSEVKLGIIPATIGPYAVRAVGARAARRYFLTAERFDARRARELGMVSEIADAADLDRSVEAIVGAILENGPLAVRAAKQFLLHLAEHPLNEALIATTTRRIAELRASDEGREGLAAFLEKRRPGWR
jgi:methylglutaconyl-CoA hydratase